MTAAEIIALLGLTPLPIEGGHFRETWRSPLTIDRSMLPLRYAADKSVGTAIYYLLTHDPDSFSALHRLPTDEVYHFYLGDPVEMLLLSPDHAVRRIILGPNIGAEQHVQFVVPAGTWQGSRLIAGGEFALLGTTMAPGFDPADYQPASREELCNEFPAAADLIRTLTRPAKPRPVE